MNHSGSISSNEVWSVADSPHIVSWSGTPIGLFDQNNNFDCGEIDFFEGDRLFLATDGIGCGICIYFLGLFLSRYLIWMVLSIGCIK